MFNIKEIRNEIDLKEDECCIVFDLGCYFPYVEKKLLMFDFSLGEETFDDYKKNHRYPNKQYVTISKRYGKKVSKVGYPYILKLKEQHPMLLCVKVGLNDNNENNQYISLVFPIETKMTKENPLCELSLHYNFTNAKISIYSEEEIETGCYCLHRWLSEESENPYESDIILQGHKIEDSRSMIFENIITPYPFSKE